MILGSRRSSPTEDRVAPWRPHMLVIVSFSFAAMIQKIIMILSIQLEVIGMFSGIPMLMVPTQGDQYRNAVMIKRAGLGE